MEIDLNKLPEQMVISREVAVNTFMLMQNLKGLVPYLVQQGYLPPELIAELPATANLIQAWDQLADTAMSALARQEAIALFNQAGIRMQG
jgi:hypothetical protein